MQGLRKRLRHFGEGCGARFVLFSFIAVLFAVGCKNQDAGFQNFVPQSDVALANLFNNTPAIRAAFSTIDPSEFNRRMDKLMQYDPTTGIILMHGLGALSNLRPALPQLADSISSAVDRFATFYQATPARHTEYNSAVDLVNRLLDVDPQAMTDTTGLGAKIVRYIGEGAIYSNSATSPLFYASVSHADDPTIPRLYQYHFPPLTTWQTCNDPGSVFLNSRPNSAPNDTEARDSLWSMYDMLRTGYCIYANRTGPRIQILGTGGAGATAEAVITNGVITAVNVTNAGTGYPLTTTIVTIDSTPGPGTGAAAIANVVGGQIQSITLTAGGGGYVPKNDDSPGAYMRNSTAVLLNSGDIELRVRNLIYDLQNNLPSYSTSEHNIADWTVNNSNIQYQSQTAVVDYLINNVYPITQKDFVFNDGKQVLDVESEHLSMKNPDGGVGTNDQYLTEWLLQALYNDSGKLDNMENFSPIDTTGSVYQFASDLISNPTYGLNSVTTRYAQANLKNLLWSGSSYTCNCSPAQPPTIFSGLMFQDGMAGYTGDGYLARLGQVQSTQQIWNPYRRMMGSRVNALVSVPQNYNGEYYLEAALKNYYFHVLDRYYDQSTTQWAITAQDAQTLFGDPERNLQGYVAQTQYSMRNMAILDRFGKKPGDAGFQQTPFLTEFLYTIAAANGYVDPANAPAQLTLQTCLYSMGATDIAADGIRTINIDLVIFSISMNAQVTNFALPADGIPASARNDEYYSASLGMFAFELLSPGRFIPRTDTEVYASDLTNGKFRGRFSPHQGDIESTGLKTSNWMVAEFALSAWEGYGPYSVKGKAANGSSVKYENDFYTDGFRSRIATGYNSFTQTAMGTNGSTSGTIINGNGNYHMYEMIYRPRNSGDACWVDSQGSTYGYARYGYIRPQNSTSYWDISNCMSWSKVRIDFDTRDEAIRANVEWNIKYKKYIFVIPMFGYTAQNYLIVHPGASFAVFSTIHGNGLWGVTTGHRAADNGIWNVSGVSMGVGSGHYISNSGNGFINEAPAGGAPGVSIAKTIRPGVQSYTAGDSMVLLEMTMNSWDGASLLVDLNQQIWDSLGNGPVTPAMIKDNFDSVLTLVSALYTTSDMLTGAPNGSTMAKFRPFYDTFFPTDETQCVGGVLTTGSGGGADLFENYLGGCGVTAADLPPVPKVNPNITTCNEFLTGGCITYPNAYDSVTGAPTSWYSYTGPSDGKLTGTLTLLVMLFGTMHEDGTVLKVTAYPSATPMAANENRDSVTIRNFCSPGAAGCANANLGYRVELDTLFTSLAALNETKKNGGDNLPAYNSSALSNVISESAPGLRNGFLPKFTNNKYMNVGYIDPLVRDIEGLIAGNVRNIEDGLQLTSGSTISASGVKNKDRLRYFATKNAVNPTLTANVNAGTLSVFQSQYHGLELKDRVTLTGSIPGGFTAATTYYVVAPITRDNFSLSLSSGGGAIAAAGAQAGITVNPVLFQTNQFNQTVNGTALNGVPINMMKEFIKYLRTLTSDADIVAAIKQAIPVINNYLAYVQNSTSQITLTDQDIDHLVSFLHDTNQSGGFSIDSFLDMLVSTKMEDLNTLRSFNFNQFKQLGSFQSTLDDMNAKIANYYDTDIKKNLLYSSLMLGEPTCPGGSQFGFFDSNKDGVWNPGTFTFVSAAYAGATSYTDTANVNGSCSITTQIPNIYDKDYYMIDMGGVGKNLNLSVTTLVSTDIDAKLNWLYGRILTGAPADVVFGNNPNNGGALECYIKDSGSGGGISFNKEMIAGKNLILCKIYETQVAEPHYDRNGNGTIDPGEYTDINTNGQYDDDTATGGNRVNTRMLISYYMKKVYQPKYNEYIQPDPLVPQKNYIHFAATSIEDLLSPLRCDANGMNCANNNSYVTQELMTARSELYASTNFTSSELMSIKNVVGNFLYDTDNNVYTDLMARTGPSLVTALQEFQGNYNAILNTGLVGFAPDGFMTYFSTNLTNKPPYTSLDVLSDIRTLFNTQAMRCYPGITGEYPGGPIYCKKYKAIDTFWGQFGLLMEQFSTAAYNQYKTQWKSQMQATYFNQLASIFE